jgi:hypothetical protein
MAVFAGALLTLAAGPAPDDLVRLTIDGARTLPVSPYIYGLNALDSGLSWGKVPPGFTSSRFGGNRLSAYNWVNNASNAGNDLQFHNDGWLSASNEPGEAVRSRVAAAFAMNASIIVTIPMLGWAAADKDGTAVPVSSPPDRTRFVQSLPKKPSPFTWPPSRAPIYQDEFVWWLDRTFPKARTDPTRTIFYTLDNEPDYWGSTHAAVRGKGRALLTGGVTPVQTGWKELTDLSIAYAAAIKDVVPTAKVFGPGLGGWAGMMNLEHHPEPDPAAREFCRGRPTCTFVDYYLDRMSAAGKAQGRRLLDVLDVHWYPEATARSQRITNDYQTQWPETIRARAQAPRSLWDRTFLEESWVAQTVPGCREKACSLELIPRLKASIASNYPGTEIAITEYYWGRAGDISGGLAQADALGIFATEGVFAATLWPNAGLYAEPYGGDAARAYSCALAAFRMFRSFDGANGRFGDTLLFSQTSDVQRTSLYASRDANNPKRIVMVALNKELGAVTASVNVINTPQLAHATIYRLTGNVGSCAGPTRNPDMTFDSRNAFPVTLPPLSVTTFVLEPSTGSDQVKGRK